MDTGHPRHIDTDDAKVLHLLGRKTRSHQVNTRAEPTILWTAFLESDVSPRFKLCHEPMDVLFGHLVDLLLQCVSYQFQVLQVLILVRHAAGEQGFLRLYLRDKLVVIDLIERVSRHLLGPIQVHIFKFILVTLANVLALLQFASYLQELLDELALVDLNL